MSRRNNIAQVIYYATTKLFAALEAEDEVMVDFYEGVLYEALPPIFTEVALEDGHVYVGTPELPQAVTLHADTKEGISHALAQAVPMRKAVTFYLSESAPLTYAETWDAAIRRS